MRNLVSYICIDCGKESTKKKQSAFTKPREEYRCLKCANKRRSENTEWKKNK